MATPVGVARYDGSFTRRWGRQEGLNCNGLRCVAVAPDGKIWIGTDLGLELLDQEGRVLDAIDPGGWPFGLCDCIDAGEGNPWIGSAQGLVQLSKRLDRPGYRISFAADIGFVTDIERLAGHTVVAGSSSHGLIESDGRSWWPYRCEGLIGEKISRLATGFDGRLLVGTQHGLFVLDTARRRIQAQLRLPDVAPEVTAITSAQNLYWIAFGRRLVACMPGPGSLRVVESYQVESQINDLLLDDLGNVWIATESSGLALVSCLRHAIRRIDLGKPGGIFSIKSRGAEVYNVGGDRILSRLDLSAGREGVLPVVATGLPESIVWDSLEDDSGIWIATQTGLFHAPVGGAFVHLHASDNVLGAPNRVLIKRDGEVWIGTLRGLARIRDGKVETIEAAGTSLGYVYSLHLDAGGTLWIGTLGRGLWSENEGLEQRLDGVLSADANTYAIAQAPDGRMIVIQDERVILLEEDRSTRVILEKFPVAGWSATWLDAARIAVGASEGLHIVDVATGEVTMHVQSYFRLRDWEFSNNRTLVRDGKGHFLCGLTSGLARVDIDRLRAYDPPACRLVDIRWLGIEPEIVGNCFHLRPGRWSFHVRAYAAWFVDPRLVGFQFQLVGFDDSWSPLRERLEATFTSLPPGQYQLVARAHAPLTGPGPAIELMQLVVSRPFWAIGWSAALASLGTLYDQLVNSRRRNRRLIEANQELERAVEERTRSLHASNKELETIRDAFQRLSEVDELTQLGNRRNFDKEFVRAIALARRLGTPLALLMVDIDNFKSVNDRLGHLAGDTYLTKVARALEQNVRIGEDVPTRFGGEEFALLLTSIGAEGAMRMAERMRIAVRELGLDNEDSPHGLVTVSIGVAVFDPLRPLTSEQLLDRADRALYRAKDRGRDCVVLAQ